MLIVNHESDRSYSRPQPKGGKSSRTYAIFMLLSVLAPDLWVSRATLPYPVSFGAEYCFFVPFCVFIASPSDISPNSKAGNPTMSVQNIASNHQQPITFYSTKARSQ